MNINFSPKLMFQLVFLITLKTFFSIIIIKNGFISTFVLVHLVVLFQNKDERRLVSFTKHACAQICAWNLCTISFTNKPFGKNFRTTIYSKFKNVKTTEIM